MISQVLTAGGTAHGASSMVFQIDTQHYVFVPVKIHGLDLPSAFRVDHSEQPHDFEQHRRFRRSGSSERARQTRRQSSFTDEEQEVCA